MHERVVTTVQASSTSLDHHGTRLQGGIRTENAVHGIEREGTSRSRGPGILQCLGYLCLQARTNPRLESTDPIARVAHERILEAKCRKFESPRTLVMVPCHAFRSASRPQSRVCIRWNSESRLRVSRPSKLKSTMVGSPQFRPPPICLALHSVGATGHRRSWRITTLILTRPRMETSPLSGSTRATRACSSA